MDHQIKVVNGASNNKDQRLPQRRCFITFSLVLDKLLTDLNYQGYEVFEFADDIEIMVRGKVDPSKRGLSIAYRIQ
jgi:hypothetical protein